MKKAIFIDKDGTLIKNVPYNIDPELVQLELSVGKALQLLKENGYLLIVISNQDGIAKGFFTWNDLKKVNEAIQRLLAPFNISIDAFYYCPHFKEGAIDIYAFDCDCRKPRPGLLLNAAKENAVDLEGSWMIGDILNDIEAGNSAGCRTILIDNDNETEWLLNEKRTPLFTVHNMMEAARIIAAGCLKENIYEESVE
jgi:D-glycero-D-manno-heptose 1,7-bisphosphate phosphatase